jgi:hypothetical protein
VLQAVVLTSERAGSAAGLGTISVTRLLATDPTTLPDVNPFLGTGTSPGVRDVATPPAASPAPGGSGAGAVPPQQTLGAPSGVVEPSHGGSRLGWPAAVLAAALVALAAGAAAVRRRSRR